MTPHEALNILNQIRLQVNATGKDHEVFSQAILVLQNHLNKEKDDGDQN